MLENQSEVELSKTIYDYRSYRNDNHAIKAVVHNNTLFFFQVCVQAEFSLKTCAIISISQGKVNFIIQTKNLKEESGQSARKTAKVKQNRWFVMSLHQLYNCTVSTTVLLLCTIYWTVLAIFPPLPSHHTTYSKCS